MEKQSCFIALGNQKGGAGKSLVSTLLSQYIFEFTDKTVLCIDADDLQQGIINRRAAEDGLFNEADTYSVAAYSTEELREVLAQYNGEYDFIVCDLPGTLSQAGVIAAYSAIDVVFIPLDPESLGDMDSTYGFVQMLINDIDKVREGWDIPVAEKRFLFNKVDLRTKLFKDEAEMAELTKDLPYPTLSTHLPEWKSFKKWKTFSLVYFEDGKKQKRIMNLLEEMYSVGLDYYNLKNS